MLAQRRDLAKRARGAWGERKVAQWYVDSGYVVLSQNWRTKSGELDLVLRKDDQIVFCEVKARSSSRFGSAVEAVDRRKQQRIRALAVQWLQAHNLHGDVRFDVASVMGTQVEVVEAAF